MAEQSSLFGEENIAEKRKATSSQEKHNVTSGEPLAARMRPRAVDEIVGQEQILGVGRLLRLAIESDRITSMTLWGPPGSGKTTLAEHKTRYGVNSITIAFTTFEGERRCDKLREWA